MTPEETREALYSLDNHQAYLGAWEIVRADNTVLDNAFLPYIEKIRPAVNSLPKPQTPSVKDIRDIVKVALNILELRHKKYADATSTAIPTNFCRALKPNMV